MSGIVGILNVDGATVDNPLLQRLTDFLAFRGPDAQSIWSNGPVGFGHTLLRTADEAASESQPASLDRQIWITADARIDAREELVEKLRHAGRPAELSRPDVELLLHAYHVWGEDLVGHILGDFCFAIWDGPTKTLFCARDHMGFKPFFYARAGKSFIFSNTLDCLRLHPLVSARLNDLAISDFLLFDSNQDSSTTSFADISRLPPAHSLRCGMDTFSVRRYWTLPEAEPVYYKHPQDCVDQFREVFDAAVGDRLRSNTACLSLSGGLDSPAVAASARRILDRRGTPSDLWAYTFVYQRSLPHEEQYYGGLVADALRIPTTLCVADEGKLYGEYTEPYYSTPEPLHSPMGFSGANPLPAIAERGRVVLTGLGGDPMLASLRSSHVRRLIKRKQFGRLAKDLAGYFSAEGRFSRLYLGGKWLRWFRPSMFQDLYPPWLNPDLEKRLDLRGRWKDMNSPPRPNHSVRPEAYDAVTSPRWIAPFEAADASSTRFPVEVRHPFFDLRVIQFLLALPALPWCSDKEILRQAARGVLPDAVRLRPKSPMMADPILAALQRPESAWVDRFEPSPNLDSYVLRDQIPRIFGLRATTTAWVHLRPVSLNFWLHRRDTVRYKLKSD